MINLQSNYPVLAEQDAEWNGRLHRAVADYGAESLRLPVFGGSRKLRGMAAKWLGVEMERALLCEAGHHALLATMMGAGLVGKTIAVETLTYPWFVRQAQMLGCRVVPVALDAECMRPEALRKICEKETVSAVYTMPSVHNPTGAVAGLARREAMVELAREFGLTMIEDGAYGFLLDEEPPRYVELAPERAFYVESLSKRSAPGLRTAFLVTPAAVAEDAELALRLIASGSSTLLVSLGCEMAMDGSLMKLIEAKRVEGKLRLERANVLLQGLEMQGEGNSWHVWVRLPKESAWTAQTLEAECEKRGVLITGAHWFTAPGAEVARAVRVGLGGETEWARVEEGLRMFGEIVRV